MRPYFFASIKPTREIKFRSGYLLSIIPNESDIPRQYSIAKIGLEVLLSIKKHQFGKGSNYLFNLKNGDVLYTALEANPNFHFPKKSESAVFIANGTGIAPSLE